MIVRQILRTIRCCIGLHDWKYEPYTNTRGEPDEKRTCQHCGREETFYVQSRKIWGDYSSRY